MALIRPRLNDHYGLPITQEETDFAIPFLDEDIPLYLDPFLLWKSPSLQDNSLHTALVNSFNHLGYLFNTGHETEATETLIKASECYEVGLGDSRKRRGHPIGSKLALSVLSVFRDIPQVGKSGFVHFEEAQLLVDGFGQDRVSDIACNFIKSFLIDFTIDHCRKLGIPTNEVTVEVYDYKNHTFVNEKVGLPQNPETGAVIILVPKRWLRLAPWINFDDYLVNYYEKALAQPYTQGLNRIAVLNYNRLNYDVVQVYVKTRESERTDCRNDPLFRTLPILSTKRRLSRIVNLPTGKTDEAHKAYEEGVCQLMASLVYPQLDFAAIQSRTDSGVLIRDLIFYNNRSYDFLQDIYDVYACRQIVMELKNVKALESEHVNQLNRYLTDQFGRFGVIVTRRPPAGAVYKNTIDLWAGQRRCIVILNDEDLETMCQLYESRQRSPIDVIKRRYIEFTRACPS